MAQVKFGYVFKTINFILAKYGQAITVRNQDRKLGYQASRGREERKCYSEDF